MYIFVITIWRRRIKMMYACVSDSIKLHDDQMMTTATLTHQQTVTQWNEKKNVESLFFILFYFLSFSSAVTATWEVYLKSSFTFSKFSGWRSTHTLLSSLLFSPSLSFSSFSLSPPPAYLSLSLSLSNSRPLMHACVHSHAIYNHYLLHFSSCYRTILPVVHCTCVCVCHWKWPAVRRMGRGKGMGSLQMCSFIMWFRVKPKIRNNIFGSTSDWNSFEFCHSIRVSHGFLFIPCVRARAWRFYASRTEFRVDLDMPVNHRIHFHLYKATLTHTAHPSVWAWMRACDCFLLFTAWLVTQNCDVFFPSFILHFRCAATATVVVVAFFELKVNVGLVTTLW